MMLLLDKKFTGIKLGVGASNSLTDDEQTVINAIERICLVEHVLDYIVEVQTYFESDELIKQTTKSSILSRIATEVPAVFDLYTEESQTEWFEKLRKLMEEITGIRYRNMI